MTNQSELQLHGLRLGVPLCEPHCCGHCGQKVDQFALHGLSCVKSKGRHYRHAAINSIIQRSLAAAQIPSTLEPNGLFRSDGKRPDGLTIAPWRMGHLLVWDATCPDTYAVSYIMPLEERAVAGIAEKKKKRGIAAYLRLNVLYLWLLRHLEQWGRLI